MQKIKKKNSLTESTKVASRLEDKVADKWYMELSICNDNSCSCSILWKMILSYFILWQTIVSSIKKMRMPHP